MGFIESIIKNIIIFLIGNIIQFVLALVFLDKYAKIRRQVIVRFLKQPSYKIGLDNRYLFKKRIHKERFVKIMEETLKILEETWGEQQLNPTHNWEGPDLYIKLERTHRVTPIEFWIKPIGDASDPHSFYTLLLEARVLTKYNDLEKDFIDMLVNMNNIERVLLEILHEWGIHLDTTTLTIQTENLKELEGFIEKIKTNRLSGVTEDGLSFDYYDRTIQISGRLLSGGAPSLIIEWIKDLAMYL